MKVTVAKVEELADGRRKLAKWYDGEMAGNGMLGVSHDGVWQVVPGVPDWEMVECEGDLAGFLEKGESFCIELGLLEREFPESWLDEETF